MMKENHWCTSLLLLVRLIEFLELLSIINIVKLSLKIVDALIANISGLFDSLKPLDPKRSKEIQHYHYIILHQFLPALVSYC